MKKKLPKSLRKHIRIKKAQIRREVLNLVKQKEMIEELYQKFTIKPSQKNNKNIKEKNEDK